MNHRSTKSNLNTPKVHIKRTRAPKMDVTGWTKEVRQALKLAAVKLLRYIPMPAPRPHRHNDQLPKRPAAVKTGKTSGFALPQHERVIAGRAMRMQISVVEYKRRFCS